MLYDRQYWMDRLVNTETGETIQDGTRFTARRMNHIEEGIVGLDARVTSMINEVLYLRAKIATNDRAADNDGIFVDNFDGISDDTATLDTTRTAVVSTSGVVFTVQSVTGFAVGQEVSLASAATQEVAIISAIDATAKTITFSAAPANTYGPGSIVARSTVVIDTAAKQMRRGGIDTYTVTISVS